jgi:hypothetical protein
MPLVRIDHPSGKPAAYRDALAEGVYEAMRLTFAVPEDDRFLILSEHSNTEIVHPDSYLGCTQRTHRHQNTCTHALHRTEGALCGNCGSLSNEPACGGRSS